MPPKRRRKQWEAGETLAEKRSKGNLLCALCDRNVKCKATGQILIGNEKECFEIILRLLEISAPTLLTVAPEWASEDFTFCYGCGKFVQEGLSMLETIQELQKRITVVKKEVISALTKDVGKENHCSRSKGRACVQRIVQQCFQGCHVSLMDVCLDLEPSKRLIQRNKKNSSDDTRIKSAVTAQVGLQSNVSKGSANSASEAATLIFDEDHASSIDIYCQQDNLREDVTTETDLLNSHYISERHNIDIALSQERAKPAELTEQVNGNDQSMKLRTRKGRKQILLNRTWAEKEENFEHPCSVCSIVFASKVELADHFWAEHSKNSKSEEAVVRNIETEALVHDSGMSEDEENSEGSDESNREQTDSSEDEAVQKSRRWKNVPRTRNNKLQCPFCETYSCENDMELVTHIYGAHELTYFSDTYGCHKCGEMGGWKTSDLLSTEFAEKHKDCGNSPKVLACNMCGFNGGNFVLKLIHYRNAHWPKENLACNNCENRPVFRRTNMLRRHKKQCHSLKGNIRVIPPQILELHSADPEIFRELRRHLREPKCQLCDNTFAHNYTQEEKRNHYRDFHRIQFKDGYYGCLMCNMLFDDSGEKCLEEFHNAHQHCEFSTSKECACTICGKVKLDFYCLVKHRLWYHSPLNPLVNYQTQQCKFCEHRFVGNYTLCEHIKKEHLDVEVIEILENMSIEQHGEVTAGSLKPSDVSQPFQELVLVTTPTQDSPKIQNQNDIELDPTSVGLVGLQNEISLGFCGTREKMKLQDCNVGSATSCSLCDYVSETGSPLALMTHVFTSHGLIYLFGLFGCKNCGVVKCTDDIQFQDFVEKHSTANSCLPCLGSSLCAMCNCESSNFFEMMGHYKEAHLNGKIAWMFTCSICLRQYDHRSRLLTHYLQVHAVPNRHEQIQYPQTPDLKSGEIESCALCSEVFGEVTKELLPNHILVCHNIKYSEGTYGCGTCGELFTATSNCGIDEFASSHAECGNTSIDFNDASLKCKYCGETCQHFEELVLHFKSEHKTSDLWCFVCGNVLRSLAALKIHYILSKHLEHPSASIEQKGRMAPITVNAEELNVRRNGLQLQKCDICNDNVTYLSIKKLLLHLQDVHGIANFAAVFGCMNCDDVFIKQPGFTLADFKAEHVNCIRNETNAFNCNLCDEKFNTRRLKYIHYKKVHWNFNVRCTVCGKMVRNKAVLNCHMQWKHREEHNASIQLKSKNKVLAAEEAACYFELKKTHYTYYVKKVPEGATYHTCALCPETFHHDFRSLMEEHVRNAHGLFYKYLYCKDLYQCLRCYEIYVPKENLSIEEFAIRHRLCDAAPPDDLFSCRLCSTNPKTNPTLRQHHILYHTENQYECGGCDGKFAVPNLLFTHMKKMHPHLVKPNTSELGATKETATVAGSDINRLQELPPYTCLICKTELTNAKGRGIYKPGIIKHYGNCHGLTLFFLAREDYFGCSRCWDICSTNETSSIETELPAFAEAHKGCTPRTGRIDCKSCGKPFLKRFKYFQHYTHHHSNKSIVCHICGKNFKSVGGFTEHMLTHKYKQPYTCNVCNAGFYKKNRFDNHMRTHTGERPYVCDICGKSFTQHCVLAHHKSLHFSERIRNVPCPECGKLFWNKKNIYSHIREVHRRTRAGRRTTKKKSDLSDVGIP